MERGQIFSSATKVVVKVGTASITTKLRLDEGKLDKLGAEIASLKASGLEVIIVSSGAIACGMTKLGLKQKPRDINLLQACAAVGQNELMKAYGQMFTKHGFVVAQILVTKQDFENRTRYLNIRNTFNSLLKLGVIPIVNENDSVSVDEIKFGDNDTLSALIASNLGADLLILMSSMDGLYTLDPRKSENAKKIHEVRQITDDIEMLDGKSWGGGVGGIRSKVIAGKTMMKCGIPMAIVDARMSGVLKRLFNGEPVGTVFIPGEKLDNKHQWMLFSTKTRGSVTVDSGAKNILKTGKTSLLPAGVTKVKGEFNKGEAISILDSEGIEFARGISNFTSEEIGKIRGLKCSEISSKLGKKTCNEIIYHDNMILLTK
ncbi:MAG: glutamate 5-kinase [Candidatus Altiarchaeota archaeon]|nr:glutamate 5-kinase [Candidatus Altiarchaeota archaeon]